MQKRYIVGLDEVKLSDLELVGGKNASLGEMIQNLTDLGVEIPSGFAITVDAYLDFINQSNEGDTLEVFEKSKSRSTLDVETRSPSTYE